MLKKTLNKNSRVAKLFFIGFFVVCFFLVFFSFNSSAQAFDEGWYFWYYPSPTTTDIELQGPTQDKILCLQSIIDFYKEKNVTRDQRSTCEYYAVYPSPPGVVLEGNENNKNTGDCTTTKDEYCLLAPLGELTSVKTSGSDALGGYLNTIFKLIIGLIAVLAVTMLVLGGIQYMSTDAISGKDEG